MTGTFVKYSAAVLISLFCFDENSARCDVEVVPTPGRKQLASLQEVTGKGGLRRTGVARGVRLVRNGNSIAPDVGIGLHEGDRIITDADTRAVIGSESGPKLSLGKNSDVTLHEQSAFVRLGAILLSIKRLFRLETRFVVAGVEGTELALSVGPSAVMALVVEGKVQVRSRDGRWAPRSYARNQGCIVRGSAEPRTLTQRAIRAFHQRDYETAVALYDQVLLAQPDNFYVLNLKGYSLFKRKLVGQAIDVQKESVRVNPDYAWGYFDLARFQCAAKQLDEARESIKKALDTAEDESKEGGGGGHLWMSKLMENDGEFQRLCRPVLRGQP
jgi:hypothetical protein